MHVFLSVDANLVTSTSKGITTTVDMELGFYTRNSRPSRGIQPGLPAWTLVMLTTAPPQRRCNFCFKNMEY